METITSRDNQRLKFARRVRDRKEPEYIFIEGKRLCREAFMSDLEIEQVFISDKFDDSNFEGSQNSDSVKHIVVSDDLFGFIADTDTPQGIIAIARKPSNRTISELFQSGGPSDLPLWICLEKPSNPSNLGAVLRTAEAAGVRGVFLTANSADPFAPKTLRASMGSAFRIGIARDIDPADLFESARSGKISVAAMDADGQKDYLNFDWTNPTLLVIGSESDGLSHGLIAGAEHVIRIDMYKPVESLNLAVAAGIVLFEAARQNRLADR